MYKWYENMRQGYGRLIVGLTLTQLCFLIAPLTQDVCAYPYRIHQNEGNIAEISHHEDIDLSNEPDADARARRSLDDEERMESDGKIVFPGEVRHVPSCKGSTYCESLDSYPEDVVNNAIKRNESLKYFATVDIIPDIAQRIDVTDDVPLCVSSEQIIFPQSAENKDNQWQYIANQENFKQGIRIEKCSTESKSCSMVGGLAEGYKTSCKQKYAYRQLASVSSDGTVVPDTFRFPSSCCCHVSFNGNPLTRMAIDVSEQRSKVTPAKTRRRI